VNRCRREFFRIRIAEFFRQGITYFQNLDVRAFFLHTLDSRAPALDFRSRTSTSIAPYSRRVKSFSSSRHFFRTTYSFRDMSHMRAKSPLISGTSRNFAIFWQKWQCSAGQIAYISSASCCRRAVLTGHVLAHIVTEEAGPLTGGAQAKAGAQPPRSSPQFQPLVDGQYQSTDRSFNWRFSQEG